MNRRYFTIGVACVVVAAGLVGTWAYRESAAAAARDAAARDAEEERKSAFLYRAHAPILGPMDAQVTITEFFDPSCEACRAFYPIVKQLLQLYDGKVRVVLRYTTLQGGSDEAVRILEAARRQDRFVPVLEVLLAQQPNWAKHDGLDIDKAWAIAEGVGLDVVKGKSDAQSDEVTEILAQDAVDATAIGLKTAPTFFVNGKLLENFGGPQLYDLVAAELKTAGT